MPAKRSTLHLLLAGWLLVVGWCATLPGVMPLAFAVLARIDGEHGVELRGAGDGVTVVLTHGEQNRGKPHAQIHRHGLLGRLLVCCAQPPRGETDHVVKFIATSASPIERRVVTTEGEPGERAEAPVPMVAVIDFSVMRIVTSAHDRPPGGPPDPSIQLPAGQRTLLLI